jgi:purine-binding chemotaxis protein CheW
MAENLTEVEDRSSLLISSFYLGGTLFGIDTMRVQEAIKVGEITAVPHAQEYVLGVINLRGRIVTVINLRKKLGLGVSEVTADSRLIIVAWEDEHVGFLLDRISDVIPVERATINAPPSNVKGVQGRFFEGVHHGAEGLLVMLKVDAILVD